MATTITADGKTIAAPGATEPVPLPSEWDREAIRVRGARVHNLKNIDFEIPHNRLTVVTGVSGSGKSSLAFDTIYAEGQRRYIESLSAYARQFLERIEKPDVDEISGIAPPVAIRQKNTTRTTRSTVATATEIYDYLRLLFARVGTVHCRNCGQPVKKDSVDDVADTILELPEGSRFYVLFQVSARPFAASEPSAAGKGKKARRRTNHPTAAGSGQAALREAESALKQRLGELKKSGFSRLYQGGQMFESSREDLPPEIDLSQPLYAVVDRLVVRSDVRQRLIDSVELAYRETGETVIELLSPAKRCDGSSERWTFNERFECKKCRMCYEEPEPRLFSFNNPFGACPLCQGFGNTIDFDLNLVIPDKGKTLAEGAINPWTKPRYRPLLHNMVRHAREQGIPLDVPYYRLSADQKAWVLEGGKGFRGVRGFFKHLERKKYKLHVRVFLSRYRGYARCVECKGKRLRSDALQVHIARKSIADVCSLTIADVHRFFLDLKLTPAHTRVAEKILEEVRSRLGFLVQVGLEYLTLDRLSCTLSGGESQRIQLASSLGSTLVGALYILDEPSIGLHARDTSRLIDILRKLRDLGNTLLVVEHDPELMRSADRILDLGPGAGEQGGRVIAEGTFDEVAADEHSLTGRYLRGESRIPVPAERRPPGKGALQIFGARQHNLTNLDVTIPLGLMTCVTGVSGSGKSTLVHDVLYNTLLSKRGRRASRADVDRVTGDRTLGEIILVDQSPLGRTPRSNPVIYLKAFDAIRAAFSSTPAARRRGYTPGTFSFNIPGGRCETCQGDGTVTVEMQFLADVRLLCEECRGRRYKSSVLEILYKGKNIHDVLQMTVTGALSFFRSVPKVTQKLRVLDEVGLGYLRLGQSATTLSGGEAQRVRLAAYLARRTQERALFLFDEPTTGLHFDDINKLLRAFRKLVHAGHTVLIIEHNMDVIKTADWIIDLGPEGGQAGGRIVEAGTPEKVMKNPRSYTGRYLARYLDRKRMQSGADPPVT